MGRYPVFTLSYREPFLQADLSNIKRPPITVKTELLNKFIQSCEVIMYYDRRITDFK